MGATREHTVDRDRFGPFDEEAQAKLKFLEVINEYPSRPHRTMNQARSRVDERSARLVGEYAAPAKRRKWDHPGAPEVWEECWLGGSLDVVISITSETKECASATA